jgi:AbrB family looped-hinge helix DNA binding protein
LVIPKPIRESLGLESGTQFHVWVEEGKVVLEPVGNSAVDALYAKYADADFVTGLEQEHQQELRDEATLCP